MMNISSQSCMLGGVPKLKFLNAPEEKTGLLLPPVCQNCASSLFKPRESRWIELKPGDSAHFIVVRTVFDSDYSMFCTVMGGLEMSLPSNQQSVRLPFEAGTCGTVRVSAWRAGRYDKDPMNIAYDRVEIALEQQREKTKEPVPQECQKEETLDTGEPFMLPSHGDLKWGLSTRTTVYGETVPVLLWIYNPTDKPQSVWTCEGLDYFWLYGLDLFDSAGRRVLRTGEKSDESIPESENFRGSPGDCGFGCGRNFPIEIPPHACVHGRFSHLDHDFSRDLQSYDSLPPGRYYLVPAKKVAGCKPLKRTLPLSPPALMITVKEP
jgi:hypothetical protein